MASTLELISDDRVRLFAVAAQVVDVDQKIDSAITECMRLGLHAIRTAMVPIPFSSAIGTPTVARILCEHILQCFGFPKALPDAVEEIMGRVVLGHLKAFMTVTMVEFLAVGVVATGVAVGTLGIGSLLALSSCILAVAPTARMLFKCACDMILILERSFRYSGKYVSVKQIEDAAVYYTTVMTTTFAGKELLLQKYIHDEVDRLIPLTKVARGIRFSKLRPGLEEIIYKNRFSKAESGRQLSWPLSPEIGGKAVFEVDGISSPVELAGEKRQRVELPAGSGDELRVELPAESSLPFRKNRSETGRVGSSRSSMSNTTTATTMDDLLGRDETSSMTKTPVDQDQTGEAVLERVKSENFFSRGMKGTRSLKNKFGLKKSKTSHE